ncbi:FAD-dependent oxidoreductase [Paenibacillus thalictri]|uniref:FAD-binding protein n=1 Tax=Paenibacillus thalictri TaxID=2527873 RepID=A0A4Q9DM38_9BACL|nr:FAD-dependent oxidoreductase [Paenibacillus thalictri]TBL76317.1 FAD-binding protein [Paenibacillus thalictri]
MTKKKIDWTDEADVVVVGYGGAGAVTAISAADAGAKVLILEKQLQDTDTSTNHTPSTRMSGGGILNPEDTEKAIEYFTNLRRIANESVDEEESAMIRRLCEQMATNFSWLESIGAVMGGVESMSPTFKNMDMIHAHHKETNAVGIYDADFPEIPGSEAICVFWVKATDGFRGGAALFKTLTNAVEKRNIPVMYGSGIEHLVLEDGEVRGVRGIRDGKPFAVKAKRGVVLTCGGFEFNEKMKSDYLRPLPVEFTGNPANTGEGVSMAQEAGADLWHMNCISFRVAMKFPEHPIAFGTQHHTKASIFIDQRGSRFTNERFKLHAFGYELSNFDCYATCYPRIPAFWVFDEKRRQMGPIANKHGACNPPKGKMGPIHYIWSEDNMEEINKGWIIKGDTLEELGQKLAADPDTHNLFDVDNFLKTVDRYNGFCAEGEDRDFLRPQNGLQPIDDGPYYAAKLWPGGPNTQGGPRRNIECQVMRPDKTPVKRLYSCGELGSFFGMLYNGGGNLAESIAMGRVAGENVAGEKPWE